MLATVIRTVPSALQMRRWTLSDYHRLIRERFLTEDDRVELLEGWIVDKMPKNPPHDGTIWVLEELLRNVIPTDFVIRTQSCLTLRGGRPSEPEPDLLIARGPGTRYLKSHPGPKDSALVIEVADSSLEIDLGIKLRVYARAGIPVYWVVSIPQKTVIVHEHPISGRTPTFKSQEEYEFGDSIPVVIHGRTTGRVAVANVFPEA